MFTDVGIHGLKLELKKFTCKLFIVYVIILILGLAQHLTKSNNKFLEYTEDNFTNQKIDIKIIWKLPMCRTETARQCICVSCVSSWASSSNRKHPATYK